MNGWLLEWYESELHEFACDLKTGSAAIRDPNFKMIAEMSLA